MRSDLHCLKLLAVIAASALIMFTASRTLLVWLLHQRVMETDALFNIVLVGLRIDGFTISLLLIAPCFLLPILATSERFLPVWKMTLLLYSAAITAVILTLEFITPSFMGFFSARPNLLFIEYIEYPKEIGATVWFAYRLQVVLGIPIVILGVTVMFLIVRKLLIPVRPISFSMALAMSLLMSLTCGLLMRPPLASEPLSPASAAITEDALINQLPLNSVFSVAHAAYQMRLEESGGARYAQMDEATAAKIVRQEMLIADEDFLDDYSTWHRFTPSVHQHAIKNLVIIVQESLSAEYVGSLGGLDLTPSLDKLADQGVWFERLYATGTRTVRGLEAVLSGYLPSMSRSVVKLEKSQNAFFTLAEFLGDRGYSTRFVVGGDAQFDNLQAFLLGNGFDSIIDKDDFRNAEFIGTWGVSDEEVLERAHREFSKAKTENKPFFSVVLSSSNHTPFQYPHDRIELYRTEIHTVENSVKYADYALGRFFELARESNYWKDTLFLVVADHNERVYGNSLIPIDRFQIPGLIIGGGILPVHYKSIASQIDLAPTLLSLMGHAGQHPMPGRDLTSLPENTPGRAMMQFHTTQAYMEGNSVVVLQPGRSPESFMIAQGKLNAMRHVNQELVDKAIAHATWSNIAYHQSLFTSKVSKDEYARLTTNGF